jgi:CheY-like chemotaxis protein
MTGKRPRSWPGPFVVSAARVRNAPPDVGAPREASLNAASGDVAPLQAATAGAQALASKASGSSAAPSAVSAAPDAAIFGPAPSGANAWQPSACPSPVFEPRRARRGFSPGGAEHASGERALAEPASAHVAYGGAVVASLAAALPAPIVSPVRRALVVDDDPEVRRALARLLRPELDVCLASSVSDAKALVAQLDRLDVAFVDWELPDGSGEQILEWLSRWPDAIRVLISARFASSTSPSRVQERDQATSGAAASCRPPLERLEACSSSRPGEKGREVSREHPLSMNPLKNRALANLVLGKPMAMGVIEALKRAALVLPNA